MKKEEQDFNELVASVATDEEMMTYLNTGKISQSIANRIFGDKIPEEYKDMIVSDEEFNKLMQNKTTETNNIPEKQQKQEVKNEVSSDDIPSITAKPNIKEEIPEETSKKINEAGKILDMDDTLSQIAYQKLQSIVNKGDNLENVINTLMNLKKVGGEVTNKSTDIATSQIVRKLSERLSKDSSKMSPEDIINYALAIKVISTLDDNKKVEEDKGLNASELIALIKAFSPQKDNSDDFMKMMLQMQQQQFQLLMKMMESNKPKDDKESERIAEMIDKMHNQYQQLIDKINKEKEEKDKMWMETINKAIEKLAEKDKLSESIKSQVNEMVKDKTGINSIDDFLNILENLTESSKKILEKRGYEVKPKEENNKNPLENPVVSKLVESLLDYLKDPSKLQAIKNVLGKSPQPEIQVSEEMPHL
ncbi:MAG: hypothetical protein RXO36_02120 [Candidatus Nanopusillus acidilobi]